MLGVMTRGIAASVVGAALAVVAACRERSEAPVVTPSAVADAGTVAPVAAAEVVLDASAAASVDAAVGPVAGEGVDFIAEARLLFRVGACAGDEPVPAPLDPAIVDAHCAVVREAMQEYRDRYVAVAAPYLAALRPADAPTVVVYPFGGGDLLSALVAFPDATEITMISLEYAGDPRRLPTLTSKAKQRALFAVFDETLRWPLRGNWGRSRQLQHTQRGALPTVTYALVALAVHGFEPTSLRYFRLNIDGTIHYQSADELRRLDGARAKLLDPEWFRPDFSPAFAHMELRFRPRGGGGERVARHLAVNLDDRHLTDDPSLLAHLEAKGRVSAMTRAANYLLWRKDFSRIRDYLTAHLVWMVSDATGIPPAYAAKAGLEQRTYGTFLGAFRPSDLEVPRGWNKAFVDLWKANPPATLPFRFGYPDVGGRAHLLVTLRRPTPPRSP
jgi:hypothetical protein